MKYWVTDTITNTDLYRWYLCMLQRKKNRNRVKEIRTDGSILPPVNAKKENVQELDGNCDRCWQTI